MTARQKAYSSYASIMHGGSCKSPVHAHYSFYRLTSYRRAMHDSGTSYCSRWMALRYMKAYSSRSLTKVEHKRSATKLTFLWGVWNRGMIGYRVPKNHSSSTTNLYWNLCHAHVQLSIQILAIARTTDAHLLPYIVLAFKLHTFCFSSSPLEDGVLVRTKNFLRDTRVAEFSSLLRAGH